MDEDLDAGPWAIPSIEQLLGLTAVLALGAILGIMLAACLAGI
jgi:hypothetical protein